jgi:uncharacterized protein YndB with AHSA1/START domain
MTQAIAKASFAQPVEKSLVLTRVLDAPRALVWQAWIDPAHMAQWWGPKHFTNPVCEMDVRPGGIMRIDMRAPDGTVYPMDGVFHEIVEPERLVFTAIARDHAGNVMLVSHTAVSLVALGGKTELTVQAHAVGLAPTAPQMLAGMEAGWTQSLEKLAEHVARIAA